ncbi:MAG: hypothetical protein KDK59_08410 [Simkania sp.]|nr:hypothetical protein [Simkania sp.]
MSNVSFLTFNYTPLEGLLKQPSTHILTQLFFNYSELTWSSCFTHGASQIFIQDGQKQIEDVEPSNLIHKVLQVGNWVILAALLTVRMTVAIPILTLTFGAKLYEYSSLKATSEEPPIDEVKPSLETSDEAILPIVNGLKDLGGEHLTFGVYNEPIDEKQFHSMFEEHKIPIEKAKKIYETILFGYLGIFHKIKTKDLQLFLLHLKITVRQSLQDKDKAHQGELLKQLSEAFDLEHDKCIEAVNALGKKILPDIKTLEGYLFHNFISYYESVLEKVQKDVDNYRLNGWRDLERSAIEKIPNEIDYQFSKFVEDMVAKLNNESNGMIGILMQFNEKHEDLKEFGLYRQGLKALNWYKSMPDPTQPQLDKECPYISKGELVYLLSLIGIIHKKTSMTSSFQLQL